jgi:hypothetical protein
VNKPTLLFALRYFACLFAVGFALGLIRVPLLVPRLGERMAELLEAPVMIAAIVSIAAKLVHAAQRAGEPVRYAQAGVLALLWLLMVEFSVVLGLRGLSLADYVAARDVIAGSVYGALLLVFAAAPAVIAHLARRSTEHL